MRNKCESPNAASNRRGGRARWWWEAGVRDQLDTRGAPRRGGVARFDGPGPKNPLKNSTSISNPLEINLSMLLALSLPARNQLQHAPSTAFACPEVLPIWPGWPGLPHLQRVDSLEAQRTVKFVNNP